MHDKFFSFANHIFVQNIPIFDWDILAQGDCHYLKRYTHPPIAITHSSDRVAVDKTLFESPRSLFNQYYSFIKY
jgi:hypothetical protein